MIHKAKLTWNVLLNTDKEEQWMKNSVLNEIQTLWIHCHAVWTKECADHLLMTDQQHNIKISRCFCDYVFKWYFDIFLHTWKTSQTDMKDIEKTW